MGVPSQSHHKNFQVSFSVFLISVNVNIIQSTDQARSLEVIIPLFLKLSDPPPSILPTSLHSCCTPQSKLPSSLSGPCRHSSGDEHKPWSSRSQEGFWERTKTHRKWSEWPLASFSQGWYIASTILESWKREFIMHNGGLRALAVISQSLVEKSCSSVRLDWVRSHFYSEQTNDPEQVILGLTVPLVEWK